MSEVRRQEALATLAEGDAALGALFAQLSSDQLIEPATIGGGDWSAKDLLGHIAFWEELAAQTLAASSPLPLVRFATHSRTWRTSRRMSGR